MEQGFKIKIQLKEQEKLKDLVYKHADYNSYYNYDLVYKHADYNSYYNYEPNPEKSLRKTYPLTCQLAGLDLVYP